MKKNNFCFNGKKLITTLLILSILFINSMSVSLAYSHAVGAVKFLTNQYELTYSYTQSGTYNYSMPIRTAIAAWNNSAARIYVQPANGSIADIRIVSRDYGNVSWAGICYYPTLADRSALISINDYHKSYTNGHESELVAHELGHAFTLADSENLNVLMREDGFRGSPAPTQDDVNGVNAKY